MGRDQIRFHPEIEVCEGRISLSVATSDLLPDDTDVAGLTWPSIIVSAGNTVDDLFADLDAKFPIDSRWFFSDHAPDAPPPVDPDEWGSQHSLPTDDWTSDGGDWGSGSSW